jgi:ubiquinone/menaquinone biosynthesis C-methylase UbiE
MSQDKVVQTVGAVLLLGCLIGAVWPFLHDSGSLAPTQLLFLIIFGILGYAMITGLDINSFKFAMGKDRDVGFVFGPRHASELIQVRIMDTKTKAAKEAIKDEVQKERPLPGEGAPRFSSLSLSRAEDILVRPSAYPMTPMYLLDNNFRIIDWNHAFTVAFDRTMEGRTGSSVLDWTYFLDNFQEVLDHGLEKFGSSNRLPNIDVEIVKYTSLRYGPLSATKRAYQVPDDDGACLAWLVTLDMRFVDEQKQIEYQRDLLRVLAMDLMWSEYATSYDRVLNSTRVYPELLDKIIGGYDGVPIISQQARILDLGAGTGNITKKLISTGKSRVIVAVENNRIMLQFLRAKCDGFLRTNTEGGGVIAVKQDIASLFGLDDNFFDFVIMNNVLYSVSDAESCLREACRVLKPGGELRLGGPRKDTKLSVLFAQIKRELKECGKYDDVKSDYEHVLEINEARLTPWLYRWSTKEVETKISEAGFSQITYSSEDIYAGQSMFICAKK